MNLTERHRVLHPKEASPLAETVQPTNIAHRLLQSAKLLAALARHYLDFRTEETSPSQSIFGPQHRQCCCLQSAALIAFSVKAAAFHSQELRLHMRRENENDVCLPQDWHTSIAGIRPTSRDEILCKKFRNVLRYTALLNSEGPFILE